MVEEWTEEGMLSPYRVLDLADEKGFLCGKLLGTYRDLLDRLKERHNGDGVSQFLRVLMLARSYGQERLERAMRQALDEGRADYDRVRQLAAGGGSTGQTPPSRLAAVRVVLPQLSRYDRLRRTAGSAERP